MTRKVIGLLVVLNFLVLSVYGIRALYIQHQKAVAGRRALESAASYTEQDGEMRQQDYLRMADISNTAFRSRVISDQDLDWCIALQKRPPLIQRYNNPASLRYDISHLVFEQVRRPTPAQREKLFGIAVSLLTQTDNKVTMLDKTSAAIIMRNLNDPRATAYLLPLLNDSNITVRRFAQQALTRIGYKVSS